MLLHAFVAQGAGDLQQLGLELGVLTLECLGIPLLGQIDLVAQKEQGGTITQLHEALHGAEFAVGSLDDGFEAADVFEILQRREHLIPFEQ